MTRSARRRWSREIESLVDGVAVAGKGPVAVHAYDFPAGGKWVDDVIPGKVGSFDRQTGEPLWHSPCEVGYGRGFGAGFTTSGDLVVLGPTQSGHAMVRMSAATGELLGIEHVPEFDEALVDADFCLCVCPGQLLALDTEELSPAWSFKMMGARFHAAVRAGDVYLAAFSRKGSRDQGLVAVDVAKGKARATLFEPRPGTFYGIAAGEGRFVLPVESLEASLPMELARELVLARLTETQDDDDLSSLDGLDSTGGPGLVCYSVDAPGKPAWFRQLPASEDEATLRVDSGKVYVGRGTSLAVLDLTTGRELGEAIVPGLDEAIAWDVRSGAFMVAEENRVSVFELPD
ncbi:hypothetical protein Pla163_08870 [Planctomycetes bacterium Pla163]|uniref:Pyrrolo-quinoline quinone repeat domain-containing protein n=1 Tax=Rohdeia mirabilis TaxID=2528008 RepID=A0A518CX51_9BACT|nr:hypothetical protein Pla163_08870 [Planctomycetes bacterium Pla163]